MEKRNDNSSKMAYMGLISLGIIAVTIGLGVIVDGMLVYGLKFFTSISESATTPLQTSMLLPFGLGMMALFCFNYIGYDKLDNILTKIMAVGFALVAMQPCMSPYNENLTSIGLLGLSPYWSNIVHSAGALIGFGAMWYWITFQFTKGIIDENKELMKIWRNRVYRTCGFVMISGILWFFFGNKIWPSGPNVWIAEELLLIPAGISCLVKGGAFLKDYNEQ